MASKGNRARKRKEEKPVGAVTAADDDELPESREDETWTLFINTHLWRDEQADARMCLGSALAFTCEAIERGGEESARWVREMRHAIERVFQQTPEHTAAFKVFEMSLIGFVRPQHELDKLLQTALETIEAERAESDERQELIKQGKANS